MSYIKKHMSVSHQMKSEMNYCTIFTILSVLATNVAGQNNSTNNTSNIDSIKDSKIVGGFYTDISYFPYQLQLKTNTGLCGGSIISRNWALTAAHCLRGASQAQFRAGTSYWDVGGTVHPVNRMVIHPSYSPSNHNNDIAVASVSTPFIFGKNIAPVALPSSEANAGTSVFVSGWGSYSYYSGPRPSQLKGLNEVIISRSTCSSYYPGITNSMVCASAPGNAVCSGDSGGPLVYYQYRIQYGVVSWGDRCTTKRPDVYANVANFRSWIKSVTGV